MTDSEVRELLKEIDDLSKIVFAKEKYWKVSSLQLQAPAKPKAIDALDKKLPYPLPKSYRSFLAVADGGENFWPNFILLSTKGSSHDQVLAEIKSAQDWQSKDAAGADGAVTAQSIAVFENQKVPRGTPPYFFVPAHSVFGANREGEFLFFDESRVDKAGEPEVVHYSYSGRVETRFKNFHDFLQKTVLDLKKRIKDKKYSATA